MKDKYFPWDVPLHSGQWMTRKVRRITFPRNNPRKTLLHKGLVKRTKEKLILLRFLPFFLALSSALCLLRSKEMNYFIFSSLSANLI